MIRNALNFTGLLLLPVLLLMLPAAALASSGYPSGCQGTNAEVGSIMTYADGTPITGPVPMGSVLQFHFEMTMVELACAQVGGQASILMPNGLREPLLGYDDTPPIPFMTPDMNAVLSISSPPFEVKAQDVFFNEDGIPVIETVFDLGNPPTLPNQQPLMIYLAVPPLPLGTAVNIPHQVQVIPPPPEDAADSVSCPADLDSDNVVGMSDLMLVILEFGSNNAAADLSQNGVVDFADISGLIGAWGPC